MNRYKLGAGIVFLSLAVSGCAADTQEHDDAVRTDVAANQLEPESACGPSNVGVSFYATSCVRAPGGRSCATARTTCVGQWMGSINLDPTWVYYWSTVIIETFFVHENELQ